MKIFKEEVLKLQNRCDVILGCGNKQADLAFLIDSSGSVGRNNWQKMLNFIKAVVDKLDIGDHGFLTGAISFGNEASLQFWPTDYPKK